MPARHITGINSNSVNTSPKEDGTTAGHVNNSNPLDPEKDHQTENNDDSDDEAGKQESDDKKKNH